MNVLLRLAKKTVLIILIIGLFCVGYILYWESLHPPHRSSFKDYKDLVALGFPKKYKVVPRWLPESVTEGNVEYNPETNEIWAIFHIPLNSSTSVSKSCDPLRKEILADLLPKRGPDWWNMRRDLLERNLHAFEGFHCPKDGGYLLHELQITVWYFWTSSS